MRIVLGADHGGYKYKELLKEYLTSLGHEIIDVGTSTDLEPASWSEHGLAAALKVASKEADVGFVFCRSGIGVCMAANKVDGVYCGLAYDDKVAELSKVHDGCNMLAFAADYTTFEQVKNRVDLFLNATFEGGRHEVRLNYLINFEKNRKK